MYDRDRTYTIRMTGSFSSQSFPVLLAVFLKASFDVQFALPTESELWECPFM